MRSDRSTHWIEEHLATALAHHQHGEIARAIDLYRVVVQNAPDNTDALHYLGVAQLQRGNHRRAGELIARAIELNPHDPHYHNNLGEVWRQEKDLSAAIACYRRALELSPDYPEANHNLGLCLAALGELDEAVEGFKAALASAPESVESHLALANAYLGQREFSKAAGSFGAGLALNPDIASAQEAYGQVLDELGEGGSARAAFCRALELDPALASAHCHLGVSLLVEGDFPGAIASFKRCIESDPGNGLAWEKLAESARFVPLETKLLDVLETHINDANLSDDQLKPLCFAFGKVLDAQDRHEQAFRYFERGNDIQRRRFRYDAARHQTRIDRIVEVFSAERIAEGLAGANPSDTPVFIVGMARSGTSLLEQILASHPQVHGAGELEFFPRLKLKDVAGDASGYIDLMDALGAETVSSMTEGYLACLHQRDTSGAQRVIDKMPDNYLHLGLIAMAFPNATIVHACRQALDVCVSIYFTNFTFGNRYACDLLELGRYYHQYARLMNHWHRVLPGRIHDVSYESLVSGQVPQTQRLVQVVNLPWDSACLRFFETERPVRTASQWQVRQPMYTDSVGRWKSYEVYLERLREGLAGR